MTHRFTYTLLQTTHPQLSNKFPNLLAGRLSDNSSNIGIFNKHKHIYNKALKYNSY